MTISKLFSMYTLLRLKLISAILFEFKKELDMLHRNEADNVLAIKIEGEQYTGVDVKVIKEFFPNVEAIFIQNTSFVSVPDGLGGVQNLYYFIFVGNENATDISNVYNITQLKHLNISGNPKVLNLSPDIKNLTDLEELIIDDNSFKEYVFEPLDPNNLDQVNTTPILILPDELGRLEKFSILSLRKNNLKTLPENIRKLNKLERIYLSENEFETIPNPICALESLTLIDLSDNLIKTITNDEFKNFKILESLILDENKLEEFPESILNSKNIKDLSLAKNKIKTISSGIVALIDLEELNLEGNCIDFLPGSIGSIGFANLVRLELSNNNLKCLPNNMGEKLEKLEYLDLSNNDLQLLTSDFKNLVNLKILELGNNNLKKLPSNFCADLTKLEFLGLEHNSLEELPHNFGGIGITSLKKLKLHNNSIKMLPDDFGKTFMNLETLVLGYNNLETLPGSFRSFQCLKVLDLGANLFKTVPRILLSSKNICNICNTLEALDLSNNQISKIPFIISNLTNIIALFLNGNQLALLPDTFNKLSKLKLLNLTDNRFDELSKSFGQIESLSILLLNTNFFTEIPECITGPSSLSRSLRELHMSDNLLTYIPGRISNLIAIEMANFSENFVNQINDNIGNVKSLRILNLQNNDIETVPSTLLDLKNSLKELKLGGNPISKNPDNRVTKEFLLNEFNYAIDFNDEDIDLDTISVAALEKKINSQEIHWNLEKIKKIKYERPCPRHMLSYEELLNIWQTKLKSVVLKPRAIENRENVENFDEFLEEIQQNQRKVTLFENYLKNIYFPETPYDLWKMEHRYLDDVKDHLEAILTILSTGKNAKDIEMIKSNISGIVVGIEHCPDRQRAELSFSYNIISIKKDLNFDELTLDTFIESEIAKEKENIFTAITTPPAESQNVHVLNYWKYALRSKTGFDFNFKTAIGTMGQDHFQGHKGNVLNSFYNHFTPDYIIKTMAAKINAINEVKYLAASYIYHLNIDSLSKDLMFEYEKPENVIADKDADEEMEKIIHITKVTPYFVEFFLIYKKILIYNPPFNRVIQNIEDDTIYSAAY